MIKRVIHISTPSHLSVSKGQLEISSDKMTNHVPIEDIGVVILDSPTITLTHPLLASLAENGVVLISSDDHHSPIGLHLPLYTHSTPSLYYRDQLDAPLPNLKQMWQKIIRTKLLGQARVLEYVGLDASYLYALIDTVKSGDTDGAEARGARYYWTTLFGLDFERQGTHSANSGLNYGYSLIRSAIARAVVGGGLLPMIGIWHDNRYNAFNLVDDLIEPFRPMVDQLVYILYRDYGTLDPLTMNIKKDLCTLLSKDLIWDSKPYDLFIALTYYVASFRAGLIDASKFDIPRIKDLTE